MLDVDSALAGHGQAAGQVALRRLEPSGVLELSRRVLEAQPGITGLWQVAGRSRTTFDEMVRLDLQYAKRQSLWTDLKILFATPAAVVGGKGAC